MLFVLVKEDVLEGDLEVAKEVSDHLTNTLKVVVDEQNRHAVVGRVWGKALRGF